MACLQDVYYDIKREIVIDNMRKEGYIMQLLKELWNYVTMYLNYF
jgi:hypothetical protein